VEFKINKKRFFLIIMMAIAATSCNNFEEKARLSVTNQTGSDIENLSVALENYGTSDVAP
jgi:hypothetical protein